MATTKTPVKDKVPTAKAERFEPLIRGEPHPTAAIQGSVSLRARTLCGQESQYENDGQRVVTGQRLMQSASDIFLGWTHGREGRYFYVRQLRDMKLSAPIEGASAAQFDLYAELCGRTLAHAHAKSGDAALISGYLGKTDTFDQAIGEFAVAYADQNAKDHAALVAAVKAGRIKALIEEE